MGRSTIDLLLNIQKKGTGAQEAERELGGAAKAAKLAGAAFVAMGGMQAARAAFELAELGAQSIRTRNAFTAISGGAEEASARLEAMQRATRGALSEQQAMAAANRLMQMGLANNADELENVTEMAVRLGTAMGRDAGASIEEFALLLANQSIPRLDTFGISAGRVRTRMAELAKIFPEMSREQRFMTATMEEGEAAMGRLGDAAGDELLQFERLTASTADLKASMGELLAGPMSELVGVTNEAVGALQLLVDWNQQLEGALAEHGQEVTSTARSYGEYEAELRRAAEVAGMVVNAEGDLVKVMLDIDAATGTVISRTETLVQADYMLGEAAFEAAQAVESKAERVAEALRRQEEGIGPAGEYSDAIAGIGGAADGTAESLEELAMAQSKALMAHLEMAGEWTGMLGDYEEYQDERIELTKEAEEEIAAIEAEFTGRRFATVRASDEDIAALRIQAAAATVVAARRVENARSEEERAAAQLRLQQLQSENEQKLARMEGYMVMTEGITQEEADKRIAAVREGLDEELGSLDAGWAKERDALRRHFAEMQVAYLENRLVTEDLTTEQREKIEAAMEGIQLKFGLVTEAGLDMADAQVVLRDALEEMEYDAWVEAMEDFEEAQADNIITGSELKTILERVDDETQQRLLQIFPLAAGASADFSRRNVELYDSLTDVENILGLATGQAKALAEALRDIPKRVDVDIGVGGGGEQEYQAGTSFAGGGGR